MFPHLSLELQLFVFMTSGLAGISAVALTFLPSFLLTSLFPGWLQISTCFPFLLQVSFFFFRVMLSLWPFAFSSSMNSTISKCALYSGLGKAQPSVRGSSSIVVGSIGVSVSHSLGVISIHQTICQVGARHLVLPRYFHQKSVIGSYVGLIPEDPISVSPWCSNGYVTLSVTL